MSMCLTWGTERAIVLSRVTRRLPVRSVFRQVPVT